MEKIIQANELTKVYGKANEKQTEALKGISFDIEKGEFIGIMGASGSGKSTLLNILSTLDHPTKGAIRINNSNITKLKGDALADFRSREIGFIFQDFNLFKDGDSRLPRYPHQTIWPYSDMVQHRLEMKNNIRTGWCRTTPLWGRGLSLICAGHSDRLHDCRARNVIEAIMWHGASNSDARWSIDKFRELSKEDRDAIVKFIDAI